MPLPDLFSVLGAVALIFFLRVIGVAIATVRTLLMARGVEMAASLLGALEVFTYIVATGAVVTNLTDWPILAAYCFGFSAGTLVGMRIERIMAIGHVSVRAFSPEAGQLVSGALRGEGFVVTVTDGAGRDGPVAVVETIVPRRKLRSALATIRKIDASAFVVVEEPRQVTAGVRFPEPRPRPAQRSERHHTTEIVLQEAGRAH